MPRRAICGSIARTGMGVRRMGRQISRVLDRFRTGGWTAVAIYLAIALAALAVLSYVFRKTNPSHLTIGAGMVMLLYLAVGAFMLLASRLFVTQRRDEDQT
jgi:hypothetical protein